MSQMRISSDVLAIATEEKERLGLRNEKEAIESMVRRFARQRHEQPQQQTQQQHGGTTDA